MITIFPIQLKFLFSNFKKHFKHLLHSVKKTESIENTGIKDVLDRFGNLAIKCYLISSKYFPITHDHNLANTT